MSKCVNYEDVLVWRLGHDIILMKHSSHLAQLRPSGTPQSRHYAQLCKSSYEKILDFSSAEIVSKTHSLRLRFDINITRSVNDGQKSVSTFRSACTNRPRHLALFSSLEPKSCCMPAAAACAAPHRPRALPAPGTTTQV